MRWPFVLRSTHERALKDARETATALHMQTIRMYLAQRDATRAAFKGLRRAQRKLAKMAPNA